MRKIFRLLVGLRTKCVLIFSIFVLGGCAYNGPLQNGFHSVRDSSNKFPISANLVYPSQLESLRFNQENIYFSHSVHLDTYPALKEAVQKTCESVFQNVSITRSIQEAKGTDAITILPQVEFRESVLYITFTVKNSETGETIQNYQASGNVAYGIPASVHTLGAFNIAFCGLLSPVVCPSVTSILGKKARTTLETQISSCLNQLADQMRNDLSLIRKAKKSI